MMFSSVVCYCKISKDLIKNNIYICTVGDFILYSGPSQTKVAWKREGGLQTCILNKRNINTTVLLSLKTIALNKTFVLRKKYTIKINFDFCLCYFSYTLIPPLTYISPHILLYLIDRYISNLSVLDLDRLIDRYE